MKDSSLACGKRIKTCRQKNGFVGPLEVEHHLIGYVAIYEVLVAAKELQVIRGTWKLIVGYLNGPWNKPYSPIQTPYKFQNIL